MKQLAINVFTGSHRIKINTIQKTGTDSRRVWCLAWIESFGLNISFCDILHLLRCPVPQEGFCWSSSPFLSNHLLHIHWITNMHSHLGDSNCDHIISCFSDTWQLQWSSETGSARCSTTPWHKSLRDGPGVISFIHPHTLRVSLCGVCARTVAVICKAPHYSGRCMGRYLDHAIHNFIPSTIKEWNVGRLGLELTEVTIHLYPFLSPSQSCGEILSFYLWHITWLEQIYEIYIREQTVKEPRPLFIKLRPDWTSSLSDPKQTNQTDNSDTEACSIPLPCSIS